MQLQALLSKVPTRDVRGPLDVEITSVCYDSRQAKPGSLFVALRGERVDGHDYLAQAVAQGAAGVMVEHAADVPANVASVEVTSTRAALPAVAGAFYHHPAAKLRLCGVTGTNGKTTTTYLLKHICERAMLRCGLIGTVRYEIGDEVVPSTHTTPQSLDLQALLARMRDAGCKATVMEVSSHALAQDRIGGVEFDAAVFTNLTQDHLDFHGSLQNYFDAKARLFTDILPQQTRKRPVAVVNVDDRYGAELCQKMPKNVRLITYGVSNRADFRAGNFRPRRWAPPTSSTRRNAVFWCACRSSGVSTFTTRWRRWRPRPPWACNCARRYSHSPPRPPCRGGCSSCRPNATSRSTWTTHTRTTR